MKTIKKYLNETVVTGDVAGVTPPIGMEKRKNPDDEYNKIESEDEENGEKE